MKHIFFLFMLSLGTSCIIAQPITGTFEVCVSSITTLSNDDIGGTWTSGTAAVAFVNSTTGDVLGIAAGTAVITYYYPGGGTATATVSVHPLPATISGPGNVCEEATTSFTNGTSGGMWTSSDEAVCTIDNSTGIASGLSSGTAAISYTLVATGCARSVTLTVNPTPFPITGPDHVCAGTSVTYHNWGSGTWSSGGSTGIITIGGTTGMVTATGEGTATITYTLPTTCSITTVVTASPMPSAVAIDGPEMVCLAQPVNFTDLTCCGIWSSGDAAIASIGSGSGVVVGLAPGAAVINYTVTNICGTYTAVTAIYVLTPEDCTAYLAVKTTPQKEAGLKVSPNPTKNGNFSITLASGNNEHADIVITNSIGGKVKTFATVTNRKNDILLEQPSGVYLITATTATGSYNEKIVIE